MHVQLIPMILLRLTIQRNFTWETFKCKHECKGGNLWSVLPNFLISKWRILKIGLFPLRNLLLYKRKRSQGKLTAESWSHPWTCLRRIPGWIRCVPRAFSGTFVSVKYQRIYFKAAVGALEKKVTSSAIQLKNRISVKIDWKLSMSWPGNATNYGNFEGFVVENTVNRFNLISLKQARSLNKRTNIVLICMGLRPTKWTEYGRNWISSCVRDFFDPY